MKKRTKKTFVAILILTMLFSWVMEKMDAIATYVSDCWDGEWMWDLDETGPNSNLPDNTVLHMDRILEGDIMFHGNSKEEFLKCWTNDGVAQEEFRKVRWDWALSHDIYNSLYANLDGYCGGIKHYTTGITDYKWMRDNGWIMNPETSYYYGISHPSDLTLKSGQKRRCKSRTLLSFMTS